MKSSEEIIQEYMRYLSQRDFPCVGAKASIQKKQAKYMVADHLGCPKDDNAILKFLYGFINEYRKEEGDFYSASVIFRQPQKMSEAEFDTFLWQRLQSLSDKDRVNYSHDPRVSSDPVSKEYSYSLKEEAFFIIGLHANSGRVSRSFDYPVLVFNPHAQFEKLRKKQSFDKMQKIIRKRDMAYSGSVNPMLTNYKEGSAVLQYSGRKYEKGWQCPLKTTH